MHRIWSVCSCLGLALFAGPGLFAADLVEVYQLAYQSDPEFQRVQAARQATLEVLPQARAQLLPSLGFSANTSQHAQDIETAQLAGTSGEVDFNNYGYSLDLTQPVFHRDRFIQLNQADSQIKQADADVAAALQDLIVRTAERYYNVLAAIDNLEFVRAEKRSLQRQLDQARQRFDVGLIAITDVKEAQAGYDGAVAREIGAENLLDNTREQLREITGEYFTELAPLTPDLPLLAPEPPNIDEWTQTALDQNLQVIASRYAVDTAREEIGRQSAGHFPTLDLVANQSYFSQGGRFSSETTNASVGLEFNMPIFQGGEVNSLTRQARAQYQEALDQLEQDRRSAQRATRESYLGVIANISGVKALQLTVESQETALQATNAGFEVGTRTAVDVVVSERQLLEARRDLARARYNYILEALRLKRAAGTLSPEDVAHFNRYSH
ncbi:MAG: TolC family outer membrane protein [Gammaproteobacteria bacterium]|nr:TolC family outer membrane protein [Gammaproteobacteria bacterium]